MSQIAPWQVSSLVGWDAAAVTFCFSVALVVHGADASRTERLATREDDSRPGADFILVAASVASLLGVGFALLEASRQSGSGRTVVTTVAVATVVICADTSNIDTVFVAGRIVKQDGRLLRVDLPSLLRRLDNARDYLLSHAGVTPKWVLSRRD